MFYYDPSGELAWTDDAELAGRSNLLHLLQSHSYPLNPEAAGRLYRALGPAPIDASRSEALQLVFTALKELGMDGLRVEDALSVVDNSWKLAIEVGN